jgi:hypothetical protein
MVAFIAIKTITSLHGYEDATDTVESVVQILVACGFEVKALFQCPISVQLRAESTFCALGAKSGSCHKLKRF